MARMNTLLLGLMTVVGSLATASVAAARVKGPEAREVRCTVNGQHKSTFTQRGGTWIEDAGRDGQFTWQERQRDEWSVYLDDTSRGMRLQLDLWTKVVSITMIQTGQRFPLCQVSDAKGRRPIPLIRPRARPPIRLPAARTRPKGRRCAQENGTCSFRGRADVYYGANGTWVRKRLTGPVACNNATFGDPLYGVVKACFVDVRSARRR